MSTMTTKGEARAWLPEKAGDLIIQPVERDSVAIQAAGSVTIGVASAAYRVPVVKADAAANWVAEGETITESQADLDETSTRFFKVAAIVPLSRELVDDSAPRALEAVTKGLSRSLIAKVDAAFFGANASDPKTPKGLGDLSSVNTISAGTKLGSLDAFTQAIYAAESVGASISAFVASPEDALNLANLKDETGSNRPLLGVDPTQPTRRMIGGVPLLVSPAVTKGTVWGIPNDGRAQVAVREDVELIADNSIGFKEDVIYVRGIMRVGFVYPHEQAIQKITIG